LTYDKLMTSLGKTYEKLMKFIRFFVNRAPEVQAAQICNPLTHTVAMWVQL